LLFHVPVSSPPHSLLLLYRYIAIFNVASFACGVIFVHFANSSLGKIIGVLLVIVLIVITKNIHYHCPEKSDTTVSGFKTPFLPFLPCLAIFINWFLVSQLDWLGLGLLIVYLGAATALYFLYGIKHSVLNNAVVSSSSGRGDDEDELDERRERDDISLLSNGEGLGGTVNKDAFDKGGIELTRR
jgi:hypothetical protein